MAANSDKQPPVWGPGLRRTYENSWSTSASVHTPQAGIRESKALTQSLHSQVVLRAHEAVGGSVWGRLLLSSPDPVPTALTQHFVFGC